MSGERPHLAKEQKSHSLHFRFYVDPRSGVVTTTVLLARHGHHDELGVVLSGRSEIALNAAGIAAAERLARRLADVPLAAIRSSPRRRCRETAAIVAAERDVPVMVDDAFDEIDFGCWSGRRFDELAGDAGWQHWNAARSTASTPAGDTIAAAAARATNAVIALAKAAATPAAAAPVLCVSHADVIRGIVAAALGLPFDRLTAFDLDPGSLTALEVDGGAIRVVSLNEQPR